MLSACGFVYLVEYEVQERKSYFCGKNEERIDWSYVGGIIGNGKNTGDWFVNHEEREEREENSREGIKRQSFDGLVV